MEMTCYRSISDGNEILMKNLLKIQDMGTFLTAIMNQFISQ